MADLEEINRPFDLDRLPGIRNKVAYILRRRSDFIGIAGNIAQSLIVWMLENPSTLEWLEQTQDHKHQLNWLYQRAVWMAQDYTKAEELHAGLLWKHCGNALGTGMLAKVVEETDEGEFESAWTPLSPDFTDDIIQRDYAAKVREYLNTETPGMGDLLWKAYAQDVPQKDLAVQSGTKLRTLEYRLRGAKDKARMWLMTEGSMAPQVNPPTRHEARRAFNGVSLETVAMAINALRADQLARGEANGWRQQS